MGNDGFFRPVIVCPWFVVHYLERNGLHPDDLFQRATGNSQQPTKEVFIDGNTRNKKSHHKIGFAFNYGKRRDQSRGDGN
ncbi:MAG: hypothetical protein DRP97_06805 [Candidatus Latescibacterota bacterium]|nr:MAG: hypothetical protein DRP97_06805 [Candidatus Latescibacterota bacterium]